MYVKDCCPVCGTPVFHYLKVKCDKYLHSDGNIQTYRIEIKNIEITDTLTEEDLIKSILPSLYKQIHNGIEIESLEEILRDKYGITGPCCRELIEKIQLELNMYSPDMKTLYYV